MLYVGASHIPTRLLSRRSIFLSQKHGDAALTLCTERISRVRCTVRSCSGSSSQLNLVDWVTTQGGKVSGVALVNLAGRDGGSGWGLKAETEIAVGTKLIELPARCHLTYSASEDVKLLRLIDQVPSELWGAKLALQLLYHRVRGADSSFSSYISNLPVGVSGIPMFFPRECIAAIEYPPVTEQVKKRCKWLFEFSQNVLGKLPGTEEDPFAGVSVDINALGWAMACVTSRAFRTKGPQHPASCLPLIDMANHSFEPNAEVRSNGQGIDLYSKTKLCPGDPLLLSYGNLSNDFLFMDYGFVINDNPHDRVQLRFGTDLVQAGAMVASVQSSDGEALNINPTAWQNNLLMQLKLAGPEADTEVTFGGPDHVDSRLLAAARILVAHEETEVQGRSLERLGKLDQPLNRRNERAALRSLSGVAAFSLSRFSSTMEEDESALLSGHVCSSLKHAQQQESVGNLNQKSSQGDVEAEPIPLTEDMRLALRFRVQKKKILSNAIRAMGRKLQELAKSSSPVPELNTAPRKGQAPPAATKKGFGQPSKA
ncbi:hypothetical protein CEUSTIGMA_g13692.t1 [Chlamydomonas eustigma]|uniref:SET domain-containing protein n=1 Tax=Chlamydomonas eustigma TaxID=1157962 RepID=A0A250XU00_9CHLO|nr:hypothetical protein CEUSTIGMA_g13692.t1 [Chlamydomonas eustigma]|eukprot:GAX86280.1 hypothetical protein CEUSTIGMA_g13692.t1 [Chlamydomonas eustigma]